MSSLKKTKQHYILESLVKDKIRNCGEIIQRVRILLERFPSLLRADYSFLEKKILSCEVVGNQSLLNKVDSGLLGRNFSGESCLPKLLLKKTTI